MNARHASLCPAVIVAVALSALSASATILTFESAPDTYLGKLYNAPLTAYGDRVTATSQNLGLVPFTGKEETVYYAEGNGWTPKIVADFPQGGFGPEFYRDNFGGGVTGVAYVYWNQLPLTQLVTLTPDNGFKVLVNSFDLKSYVGRWHIGEWSLHAVNQAGPLLTSGTFDAPSGVTDSVVTGMEPYWGPVVLKIVVQQSGSGGSMLGLDNLNFDQVSTPEPSAFTLACLVGVLTMLRRRR